NDDYADWADAKLIKKATDTSNITYISEMSWLSSSNGWGPIMRDYAHSGVNGTNLTPITLGGQEYAKGVGAHAESEIQVALDGEYETFKAIVGADDIAGQWANVVFKVYGDDELLFESPQMLPGNTPVSIDIDVSGVDILTLYADPGTYPNDDYADWADARLEKSTSSTTSPPSSTTVTTYGSGLIYLRARWYDPSIGRFISTDPYWNANNMIYGNNGNGGIPSLNAIRQSNNRYVYALNNPLRYKDSTGRVVTDWDRGHLTASELSRLQAITNSWSSGTASQQNAWRTEAYNMRVKYLTQGEYITSDGYVKSNVLKPISSTPTIVAPIKQSDVPPSSSGYNPPKGGPKKDNETHGWVDNNGNIWVPDKSGHGGDHWDVQYPNGGYDNVYPDGSIRAGAGGRGKFSPSITIDKAAIGTSSIIAAGAYVVYQGTQWVVQQVLPYALVLAPLGI
ncbi:MAG: NPCBM/NEW2 domain-containing protein, partial [Tannerellaceae bacterium]|nr:NPCBM/NEW2 domain-containing protein [Tannerellaceae bacterium]